jgi:hypothetical protein
LKIQKFLDTVLNRAYSVGNRQDNPKSTNHETARHSLPAGFSLLPSGIGAAILN